MSAIGRAYQTVAGTARRALSMLPSLPWYAWGGAAGLGAAAFLATRSAVAAAQEAPAERPPGSPPTLKEGASGPWVLYLQSRIGADRTGVLDAATLQAVKEFQASRGLAADGVVGPATWGALGEEVSAQPGPPAGPPPPAAPKPSEPAPAPKPSPGNSFGLPDTIAAREALILQLVAQGRYEHEFVPLKWTSKGREITVFVSRRALALRDGPDRLVVSVSLDAAQKIADQLGAQLLTTRVADEVWNQAAKRLGVLAHPQWVSDETMASTKRMIEQSALIDSKVADAGGLVANEGKDWVITRRFWLPPQGTGVEKPHGVPGSRHNSANFGWYGGTSKSPGGVAVTQSVGLVHDRSHADYSQLWRGMLPGVIVDGVPMTAASVLADPTLSYLLNDEGGTVPAARHPDLAMPVA